VLCALTAKTISGLQKTDAKHMSLEVFKKIVAPLLPTTSVLVAFGLGEPFLNKELMEILKQAKTINPLTNIFVSTNGTRLSEEISREIVVGHLIDVLQISIDGASEETYAKIRRRAKSGNDYDIVLDALKTVIRIKKQYNQHFPRIKVEMLVNQHTSNDIFMFVEQMTNLGVNMIALDSVKGEYPGLGLAECDIPSVYAELQRARAYAEGAGVAMEGPLFNELSALLSTAGKAHAEIG
jgi:MoaA/NifB/PqqE/SkfB family radical SAM enzyme